MPLIATPSLSLSETNGSHHMALKPSVEREKEDLSLCRPEASGIVRSCLDPSPI